MIGGASLGRCLLLFGWLLLGGCSFDPAPPQLRIATNIWPGYEPIHLAQHLQQWPDDQVRLFEYPTAAEGLRALRNRSVDAIAITMDEVLLLRETGIPVSVVLVLDISAGGDVIVAAPSITSVTALRGKTVALEEGALASYVLSRALSLHNMTLDDVTLRRVGNDEKRLLFQQGEVDAVVTYEPLRTLLLRDQGHEIFSSRQIPDEIMDALVVHEAYLTRYPQRVREVIDGWFIAIEQLRQGDAAALRFIAERMRFSQSELAIAYRGLRLPDRQQNRQLLQQQKLIDAVEHLHRLMRDIGLLSAPFNGANLLVGDLL